MIMQLFCHKIVDKFHQRISKSANATIATETQSNKQQKVQGVHVQLSRPPPPTN